MKLPKIIILFVVACFGTKQFCQAQTPTESASSELLERIPSPKNESLKNEASPKDESPKTTYTSLALALPQGFDFSFTQNLATPRWALRVSIGGWPIERAWPLALTKTAVLGESYAFNTTARLFMLNSGVHGIYQSSRDSLRWLVGLDFWMLDTGALIFLKNRETNESAFVAEMQSRWWQPMASIGVLWAFSKVATARRWELEARASYLFLGGLRTELQGPIPAMQTVAPEYADALEDGSLAAEKVLSSTIRDRLKGFPLMPSLGIRYTF